MERIEVDVEVTERDFDEFRTNWSAMVRARKQRRLPHLITDAAIAITLTYVIYRYWSDIHWPTALVVTIIAFYSFGFFIVPFFEGEEASTPKRDGFTLGKRHYTFSPEGIAESCSNHSSQYDWSLVEGVQETENLVIIMLDSAAGIILPRRDLPETEALLRVIRSRVSSLGSVTN